MATDSAALDRRRRPTRRAIRSAAPRIQSPAAPIAEGIGLDQPFFEDKNRAFWILQSAGWTGYFILRSLSGFANSMGWMFVIHTLLLTATGYSLTLLMATLFRRLIAMRALLTVVLSLAAVMLAATAFSAAALAVSLAVLLAAKDPMHGFVLGVVTKDELNDFLILAAATLIILPLCPINLSGLSRLLIRVIFG